MNYLYIATVYYLYIIVYIHIYYCMCILSCPGRAGAALAAAAAPPATVGPAGRLSSCFFSVDTLQRGVQWMGGAVDGGSIM